MGDVISWFALEPAKTSKSPGKVSKRTAAHLQELEGLGQDVELYRKAMVNPYT